MVDRIQKLIQAKKLTASKFADQIGVPRSTISHILSGRNNPSLEFLQKILDTYPDIKTEWLIRGDGPMRVISNSLFSEADFLPENDSNASSMGSKKARPLGSRYEQAENPAQGADNHITADEERMSISPDTDKKIKGSGQDASTDSVEKDKKGALDGTNNINEQKKVVGFNAENDTEKYMGVKKKAAKIIIIYADETFSEHIPN